MKIWKPKEFHDMLYRQYWSFLQDALNILNDRIRNGYQFQYVVDEQVEFTDTGLQTFQKPRWRLYLLVREVSEQFLQAQAALDLIQILHEDDRFLRLLNVRTMEGQPVTDLSTLTYFIKKRFLCFRQG